MQVLKYPRLYNPEKFMKIIKYVGEKEKIDKIYVQPKYDGILITFYNGKYYTRNLHELERGIKEVVEKVFEDVDMFVMDGLSGRLQFFFEVGGRKYAPAGFNECWGEDYEFVLVDIYDHGVEKFLKPDEVRDVAREMEIPYVGYRLVEPGFVHEWEKKLEEYMVFEGFVVKFYVNEEIAGELWKKFYHRQKNAVMGKFKHEYIKTGEKAMDVRVL